MASYSLATDYYKQREFAIMVIPEVEVATAEPQHVLRVPGLVTLPRQLLPMFHGGAYQQNFLH